MGRLCEEVPAAYLYALMLKGAGADDEVIAGQLGIPVESVATTLRLARVKVMPVLEAGG